MAGRGAIGLLLLLSNLLLEFIFIGVRDNTESTRLRHLVDRHLQQAD